MINNSSKPIIVVSHAKLTRFDDSPFRSECPVCKDGMLPVHRNNYTFKIDRRDHCIACGQRFEYLDDLICGEVPHNEQVTPPASA
jgi:hypothetical protein